MTFARAQELVIDRCTEGLDGEQTAELEALLADGDIVAASLDAEGFELAAAAIELACSAPAEDMPESLRSSLDLQAKDFFENGGAAGGATVLPFKRPADTASDHQASDSAAVNSPAATALPDNAVNPRLSSSIMGWLAAAACLVLAVIGWNRQADTTIPIAPVDTPAPSIEARMNDLLNRTDTLTLDWSDGPHAQVAGVTGQVAWNNAAQQGFMSFTGLPANDPSAFQYQLWIFDSTQDERYPVDGGVFNVQDGQAIIPIEAKIQVNDPTLFAITVEKPGGVVVSSRERLVLVGAV